MNNRQAFLYTCKSLVLVALISVTVYLIASIGRTGQFPKSISFQDSSKMEEVFYPKSVTQTTTTIKPEKITKKSCPKASVSDTQKRCLAMYPILKAQNSQRILVKLTLPKRGVVDPEIMRHAKFFQDFANDLTYQCRNKERFGHEIDGGWFVCLDNWLNLLKAPCLIYSFGIGQDWSFDDMSADVLPCTIHSFDPTIKTESYTRVPDKLYFHDLGLSFLDLIKSDHNYVRLSTIMHQLNHTDQLIDYLKIDIERAEWKAMSEMMEVGLLREKVRQLAVEFHMQGFAEVDLMKQLFGKIKEAGFALYHSEGNPGCSLGLVGVMPFFTCYELYFVNTNFMNP